MSALLPHLVAGAPQAGVQALHGRTPPPRVRLGLQAQRTVLRLERCEALSGLGPFSRSSCLVLPRAAIRSWPAPETFPRATDPFRHPPVFALPSPAVRPIRDSRSPI